MSINNLNTYLNVRDAHLRVVSGNVYAQAMNIGGINVETAHGLQSVSNTGNATSLTLEFANVTTGFVTTANAQIGRDLVVTGNATVSTDLTVSANATVTDTLTVSEHLLASKEATVTGNLHVTTIRSDSNVVAEYTGPHDRPLRKYPEVAMTQNDESATSGYVASASSTATYNTDLQPENAFNGVISPSSGTASWQSSDSGYSGTTPFNYLNSGTHTVSLTDTDGMVHYGDWLSLQTPNRIKVSYYKIHTLNDVDNYRPDSFVLLGSNSETDGTWKLLHTETGGMTDPGPEVYTGHVNSTEFYTYHRLLVKSLAGNGGEVYINELEYYGYEEGSGSLDTTLKTVYNVPATTGTQLDVYYDGQDYGPSVPTSITDKTGNGNNTTTVGSGIGFDSTYKAFTFDGTSNGKIVGTHDFSGDASPVLTMSFWMKRTAVMGSYDYIATIGTAATGQMIGLTTNPSNQFNFGNEGDGVITDEPILLNQWYHVTLVANGEAAFNSTNFKPYINGKEPRLSSYGGGSTTNLTGSQVTFGTNSNGGQPFKGSIANFRLYSKALNADQVKELYDFQKDYFLGSKSQVTLYKGHLGVGVTEPSGQLELAGDERLQEYPPRDLYQYDTNIEGHGVFCVSASNEYLDGNHPAWEAFGDNATSASSESVWTTNALYSASTGLHTGSATTAGIKGEWIQLKTPYKIKISSFNLNSYIDSASNRQPRDFILLGSNDGNVWEQMKSVTGQTSGYTTVAPVYSGPLGPHHTVNSTKYYSYFRIVVTANQGEALVGISRIRFYGTPGPTTLDKGSLTLGRSLDVPRVSRYDVDTETPRPEKLVVDFDTTVNSSPTDISGNGNHGVMTSGVSYSATDKAFVFNATGGSIVTTFPSIVGDNTFSVSLWVKRTADAATYAPFFIGDPISGQGIGVDMYNTGPFYWFIYSGKNFLWNGVTDTWFPQGTWTHLVCVHTAGTDFANLNEVYINGVPQSGTATFSGVNDLSLDANDAVTLGRRGTDSTTQSLHGQISNFKMYNVALEPSEVKKLYNLGRTGRSMVISDTAVGIGKAPEAQLDIRGNLKLSGLVMPHIVAGSWGMTGANPSVTTIYMNEGNCVESISNQNVAGQGNGISGNRGRFTAPVTGLYNISFNFVSGTRNSSQYLGSYSASGGAILTSPMGSYREMFDMRSTDNVQESYAYTMCAKMDAGDIVKFSTYSSSYVDGSAFIVGSVYLIYAIPRATW